MDWWQTARRQGGVISIGQLRESGVSDTQIDSMVRRSALVAVLHGIYRWASTPLTVRGRRYAAALWSRGAISFTTAGDMWGLGVASRSTEVDVAVADRVSRNGHPEFVRVHRVILGARDIEEVDGLPITTKSRTTLDLVGSLPRRQARDLFERGFREGWFSSRDLDRRLTEERGRSGNRILREFRDEISPDAQAEFERRVHRLLRSHHIVGWVPQYAITTSGGRVHADIAFPDRKLILELDGWSTHGTRDRFTKDRRRDRHTLVAGWRTARFTWADLDDPAAFIAEIVRLLAS